MLKQFLKMIFAKQIEILAKKTVEKFSTNISIFTNVFYIHLHLFNLLLREGIKITSN